MHTAVREMLFPNDILPVYGAASGVVSDAARNISDNFFRRSAAQQ
jgi:hypothetical protein